MSIHIPRLWCYIVVRDGMGLSEMLRIGGEGTVWNGAVRGPTWRYRVVRSSTEWYGVVRRGTEWYGLAFHKNIVCELFHKKEIKKKIT